MKIENDLLHQAAVKELTLAEYKGLLVFLSNTPINRMVDTLESNEIIKILSFLNFYEETHEISVGIAKYMLMLFPVQFDSTFWDLLISISTKENYILSQLVFDELNRRINENSGHSEPIWFIDDFINLLLNYMLDENEDLSFCSQKLMINYCKQNRDTCMQAFSKVLKPKFSLISLKSVFLFRYIDVVLEVGLSTANKEIFEMVVSPELVNKMMEIISSDDVLGHINCLVTMRRLVSHQLGYQMLTFNGVLKQLYLRMIDIDNSEWKSVLLPEYLSVFTELCHGHSKDALMSYDGFIKVLHSNMDSTDMVLRSRVLEITAAIVVVPECKLLIHSKYDRLMPTVLVELTNLYNRSTTENQVRAGRSLTMIFSAPQPSNPQFQAVCDINSNWFNSINGDNRMLTMILSLMKLPIEELRLAGLQLVREISNQNWAVHLIGHHTELVDFIIIRADDWKSCIDMKYELITNLVETMNRNPPDTTLCPANNAQKLRQYLHEGKYFMAMKEPEMMVAEDI